MLMGGASSLTYADSVEGGEEVTLLQGQNGGEGNMLAASEARKAFDKIQHLFMIRTFRKVEMEGNALM